MRQKGGEEGADDYRYRWHPLLVLRQLTVRLLKATRESLDDVFRSANPREAFGLQRRATRAREDAWDRGRHRGWKGLE